MPYVFMLGEKMAAQQAAEVAKRKLQESAKVAAELEEAKRIWEQTEADIREKRNVALGELQKEKAKQAPFLPLHVVKDD